MAHERPLLDPSPRTPSADPLPVPSSLSNPPPPPPPPLPPSQNNNLVTPSAAPATLPYSSSRRTASGPSRLVLVEGSDSSGFSIEATASSVRVAGGPAGGFSSSTRRRYGSRGAESDGYTSSQREISDDDARLVYINDPDRTNEKFEFAGNSIRTAKYSVLTFLPRNLFEQFHRVAYIYFLVIAILNQLPQLAVFGRATSFLPLAFVLLVTAVKDAYEDWRRHRSDRIENNRVASVLSNGQFAPKSWKDIRVGEIIKIQADETLPCDMVLLSTSDPTGVAYVQTINLDGESNLKTRYAKQETLARMPEKEGMSGLIRCEKPNRNIYGFIANMEVEGKRLSLGPSNIALRGC